MAVVKGSQQERLVIRQYQPWERFRRAVYFLLLLARAGAGGYYGGLCDCMSRIQRLTQEGDALRSELQTAERSIASFTQRVNVLEKGGEVDRKATEGIRQTVKELKAQISTLEEEVAFYKGIMAPKIGRAHV